MFDPFGGDDSLGAWLYEQQLLKAEKEREKRREEEQNKSQSYTSILDRARAKTNADIKDAARKFIIDSCSQIDERSVVTENINNVYELVASLNNFKEINERMEIDTAIALREGVVVLISDLDEHLARIEGFKRGALKLAKASNDRGDYELATTCLEVVGLVEEKLSLFIRLKERITRESFKTLF